MKGLTRLSHAVAWTDDDGGREEVEATSHRHDGERVVDACARRLASDDRADRAAAAMPWGTWARVAGEHAEHRRGRRARRRTRDGSPRRAGWTGPGRSATLVLTPQLLNDSIAEDRPE